MTLILHFCASASSTSCRRLAMFQSRMLQNCPGNYSWYSPCSSAKYAGFSKKVRLGCTLTSIQPKVLGVPPEQKFHLLKPHASGQHLLSSSFIAQKFGCWSIGTASIMSVPSYGSLRGLRSTSSASTGLRSFQQVSRATGRKNYTSSSKDGQNGNSSSFKIFNRFRKHPKAFASHSKDVISNEALESSPAKDALKDDLTRLSDELLKNTKNNGGIEFLSSPVSKCSKPSKVKQKAQRQSRSTKTESQSFEDTVSSAAVDQPKVSKRNSRAKKTSSARNNQSTSTPKGKEEGIDTHTSRQDLPEQTKVSSCRKVKPVEGADALVESGEELTVLSGNKASQCEKLDKNSKTMSRGQKTFRQLYPPTAKTVVVVESVTKAKVIQGYLGEMVEVLPSYGHVRDLAARSGSVRPDDDFSMVWEVPSAAWTHLKSIKVSLSGAENLVLASDPDREGEAIAWHIIEMLKQQDALRENVTVARVVFNEITESSIKSALQAPREIDANLVHAYLARRALDYLIGFNISPLLWRKLPGCQSAGRVQSAALALICDREKEIDEFKPQEYWTVEVEFYKKDQNSAVTLPIVSHLSHFDSKKLNQLSISSLKEAEDIKQKISLPNFEVVSSKRSKTRKNPPTPYITSSLQQDAANKLNFTASYTMKVAQKLYEGIQLSDGKSTGLITYMRTDGLHISDEAAKDIQSFVIEKYGDKFASKSPRKFFKKLKNAQEAHEAIRPTNIRRLPSVLTGVLDEDSLKLYTLIWSRTMACQMEPAIIEQIQLDIGNSDQSIILRSTCSKVDFPGYQAVYKNVETNKIRADEDEGNTRDERFEILSDLKSGQQLSLGRVELGQHHTQPPSRYSEGSLIKKLEELGIGRPSTYATTIKVLKDRNYVTVKGRTLYPEFRGRMVSAFLSHHFSEVTDYSFTADMETELDNVSAGLTEWKGLLKDYWTRFSKYCERASNVHIHQVEKMLEKTFGHFLFASLPDGDRTCPSCHEGTLIFKVSRFGEGYFIGCDQHPKCKYIAQTLYGGEEEDVTPENRRNNIEEPKMLGYNPGSNEKVLLKKGPYGYYVQLGEDRKGYIPKRASLSQVKDIDSISLEDALELLRYPITLGNHPDDGQPVILKLAKVGFSVRHRRTIASVPKSMKPNDVTLEKALELLSSKDVRRCGRPKRKKNVEAVEAL